jgi:protein SCO1/2
MNMRWVVTLLLLAAAAPALAHDPPEEELVLPMLGPAPAFELLAQDRQPLALADLRGKPVVVTFIYTACPDMCPLLTQKLVAVQEALGPAFGRDVAFVSITVDPELDTPEVLAHYAGTHGADLDGWSFLTGEPEAIAAVTADYGLFAAKAAGGQVDHTFLTSLIDAEGNLRLQYLGYRFDPEAFLVDLRALMDVS